ncbi:MAG TPA: ABC transporter permease [Candidatus Acidoferrales bacterium]|jgi:oligopeptide transport system permease protein|nr:ABC transporter permease [Candidatus Acidoferrales bacterium]
MATTVVTPVPTTEYSGGTIAREQVSLWRDGWRRLRRNKLALAAVIYLALLVLVAIVSFFWTPYKPNFIGACDTYQTPSPAHLFGCDELGRDSLSRLMAGTQVSLFEGVGTALIVLVVGVTVGLIAGYFRGVVDAIISLIINIFYGIPTLLVALVLVVLLGQGLVNIMVAISATIWMDMARLVRGQTLSIREREYVEAARASGAKSGKILFGHIFPNALGPIIVQATFIIPVAILTGAFLSFLGLGVPPPQADWGGMASEGTAAIRYVTHIVMFPSLALSVTLLAFNFFGDGLRDAFDPRQRR